MTREYVQCAHTHICHAIEWIWSVFLLFGIVFVSNKMPYDLVCTMYVLYRNMRSICWHILFHFFVVRDQILPGTQNETENAFVFLFSGCLCSSLCVMQNFVSLLFHWTAHDEWNSSKWIFRWMNVNLILSEINQFSLFALQHINYTVSVVIWCA